jgi:glycosyltransferase involved in cell wall biosynthesis
MLNGEKHGRVAVLFQRMGPYHFARLRAAGKIQPITLVEIFKEDAIYGWNPVAGADGFERLTLFEKQPQPASEMRARLQAVLDDCRPSAVVISGWSDIVAFSAIQWCAARRVPAIMMSESTEWDEPRRQWKEWIKRRILKMCAAGLVGGKPHVDYLARLGIPSARIFQGYDAVDNAYFAAAAEAVRNQKPRIGTQPDLPGKYFMASARFVGKKNLALLLRAYASYRELAEKSKNGSQQAEVWDLVLLGDGPLRSAILNLRSSLGLEACVHLPGFKQYDELPAYYGFARAFIHASTTEQWGLVVNEAMACGLPVLVSNRCGCAQDLVKEGLNGFTFDPTDAEQLAGLMLKISTAKFPLSDLGAESRRIVKQWGPERFADGLARAVDAALAVPRPQAGMIDRLLLKLMLLK